MDIFKNATKMGSFNNWLTNLPEEDLQYLSNLLDEINDKGEADDMDTYEQLVALVIHFSGEGSLSEEKLIEKTQSLAIQVPLELNVRQGNMTKEGTYSLVDGEETATFKMTEKGFEYVRNMIERSGDE